MKPTALALAALLVALSALGVALLRRPGAPPRMQAAPAAGGADPAALAARVERLESELARLDDELALLRSNPPGAARDVVEAAESQSAELAARVVQLERELAEVGRDLRAATPPEALSTQQVAESRARQRDKELVAWTRLAKDAAATEEERLNALRKLRGTKLADGSDARLGALAEAIQLAESTQDAEVRADVWRQLSGVTDRSLVSPLLHSLQNDPSAEVREEAAETLAGFLAQDLVRGALQFAADNDASPDVRAQALESLGGRRR
jgi:hypothetical protein